MVKHDRTRLPQSYCNPAGTRRYAVGGAAPPRLSIRLLQATYRYGVVSLVMGISQRVTRVSQRFESARRQRNRMILPIESEAN